MIKQHKLLTLAFALFCIAVMTAARSYSTVSDGLQSKHISQLMALALQKHVSKNTLTPEIGATTLSNYINMLDSVKVFFLEPDIKAFYGRKALFPLYFKNSDWNFVTNTYSLFLGRVHQQYTNAVLYLSSTNFVLDMDRTVDIDTKDRSFCATPQEARIYLEDILQYQVAYLVSVGEPVSNAVQKVIKRRERLLKRYTDIDAQQQFTLFVNAFCLALDPHTAYLSPDDMEDFEIGMALSLEGIGALLGQEEGITVIKSLTPGGPSEKSGLLKPGDKIIAVAQDSDGEFVDIIDMDLRDVVKKIRGKKDSVVRLKLVRKAGSGTERKEISLTRDKVELEDQAPRLEYVNSIRTNNNSVYSFKIAVIDLPSFYLDPNSKQLFGEYSRSAVSDVTRLLKNCQTAQVDGVILDLQRNGGGLLDEAVYTAGLFLKKGNIVLARDRNRFIKVLPDTNPEINYSGPLIITTSRATASGAEIVAGALKDYRRALIVGGDHTYGKGTIQQVIPLSENLGALKITSGEYYIASGRSPQNEGVLSDIEIPSAFSAFDIGEHYQANALPSRTVSSMLSSSEKIGVSDNGWSPLTDEQVSHLKSITETRLESSKAFIDITNSIDKIKKDREKSALSIADLFQNSQTNNLDDVIDNAQLTRPAITNNMLVMEAVQIMTDWLLPQPATTNVALNTGITSSKTILQPIR